MPQGSSAVRPTNGVYLYLYLYLYFMCNNSTVGAASGIYTGPVKKLE